MHYEIHVDCVLDSRWAEWFTGLDIHGDGGQTVLSGILQDHPRCTARSTRYEISAAPSSPSAAGRATTSEDNRNEAGYDQRNRRGPELGAADCSLPTAARPLQLAEFDDLFATAIESSERVDPQHARLILSGSPDLQDTVRDLATRENECCSFFGFTVRSDALSQVVLDIEVPDTHVDVPDALMDRADRLSAAYVPSQSAG